MPRTVRWYAMLGVVLATVPLLAPTLAGDHAGPLTDVAVSVAGAVMLVTVTVGMLRTRPVVLPRACVAAATLCWSAGQQVVVSAPDHSRWGYVGVGIELAGYAAISVGIVALGRLHRARNDLDSWLDSVVLVVAVLLASLLLVTRFGQHLRWQDDPAGLGGVVLLVSDIALAGAYLRLLTLTTRHGTAEMFLLAALVGTVAADIVSLMGTGARYSGQPVAASLWILSWSCLGLFALHPGSARFTRSEEHGPPRAAGLPGSRVLLLWFTAMVPAGALALADDALRHASVLWWILAAMAVVFVLVLVRLARAVLRVERDAVRLAGLAERDELTGLVNRRGAVHAYAAAAPGPDARRRPATVAILDIDHFKAFNDTRGHLVGDALLRDCARVWSAIVPHDVVLSRHGGEEFVLIARERSASALAGVVDELRAAMPAGQSFSAGVVQARPGESYADAVDRADQLLYAAKAAGRGRTHVEGSVRWRRRAPSRSGAGHAAGGVRDRRLVLAVVLVGALALALYPAASPLGRRLLHLGGFPLAAIALLAGPVLRGRQGEQMASGFAIVVAGWVLYVVGILAPGPHVAGMTLPQLGSVVSHLGLVPMALRLRAGHRGDRTAWIDSAMIAASLGLVLVTGTATAHASGAGPGAPVWFTPLLALASVAVLAVLVQALLSYVHPPLALVLLVMAQTAQVVGDAQALLGPVTSSAEGLGAVYGWFKLASLVGLAVATAHPSMRALAQPQLRPDPGLGRRRLVLLAVAGGLPPLYLAWAADRSERLSPHVLDVCLLTIAATDAVVVTLVVWRLRALLRVQARLAARLRLAAVTDPLTGLGNRRAATHHLDFALGSDTDPQAVAPGLVGPAAVTPVAGAALAGEGDPFAAEVCVAMIDLDHFKAFNDGRGHTAGDALLRTAARVWAAGLGPQDRLYRFGGEEFLLVCRSRSLASTVRLVDDLRALTPDGQSFSAGVAPWDGEESRDHLLGRADAALYRAKDDGRGCTRVAQSGRRNPGLRRDPGLPGVV